MSIFVNYDRHSQTAVVGAAPDLANLTWADIRRVCEQFSDQIETQRARSISIPWWTFLVVRADLLYVLNKYGIEVQFNQQAMDLLAEAKRQSAAFRSNLHQRTLEPHEIRDRLQASGFTRELTAEQARNVASLINLQSAASFSVPGAGKTTEALAYFFLRRDVATKMIIVAPKNAFSAWEEQLEECAPRANCSVVRLQGGEAGVSAALASDPTVAIISYQQLCNVIPQVAAYLTKHPCFMVLDESHRMKKGSAGIFGSAVLKVSHLPLCKLVLSGTPMPNSTADLVPQFRFLYPMIRATENDVAQCIQRIYVRTTKGELGLRPPVRVLHPVSMNAAQMRLYDSLRSEAALQLQHLSSWERVRVRSVGRSVMRLMQTITEPALLTQSDIADTTLLRNAILAGPGPKILEACRIARELSTQGKKCIIWSQFVQVVETVADMLSDLGAVYIHGGVEVDDDDDNMDSREAKIRKFHDDPSCMVIVANPAACAEGISLHRICHHAIYIDRNYNAAQYLQSEDRIHRLGLKPDESTYILVLHTPNTIDDSIRRRLETKTSRMGAVLNDRALSIEPAHIDDDLGLNQEDLEDLREALLGAG